MIDVPARRPAQGPLTCDVRMRDERASTGARTCDMISPAGEPRSEDWCLRHGLKLENPAQRVGVCDSYAKSDAIKAPHRGLVSVRWPPFGLTLHRGLVSVMSTSRRNKTLAEVLCLRLSYDHA